jgi:hypothetical protein
MPSIHPCRAIGQAADPSSVLSIYLQREALMRRTSSLLRMGSTARIPVAVWWAICAVAPVAVRLRSTGLPDGTDALQHYLMARHAWQHPRLLLDQWGKPLFTLLASPFAQLGQWGMVLFNAICLFITAWAADGLLKRAGPLARWTYAPALLLVPVYGTMVLAGMTEVLFGMLAMLVVRALFDGRPALAMAITSFMPFARPEYIAFVPFAFAWVAWGRQWKALRWVLLGPVLYAVAGLLVLGDPFWPIHDGPYTDAHHIYGHGRPLHFVSQLQRIYGPSLMWTLGLALFCGILVWQRFHGDRPTLRLLLFIGLLPAMAIFIVHSILWWQGWKGSLGLTRVLATTAPLAVLCAVWPVIRMGDILFRTTPGRWVGTALGGLAYFGWAFNAFIAERPIPIHAGSDDRFFRGVAEEVARIKGNFGRVLYYHPSLAYYAGLDPFDTRTVMQGWRPDTALPTWGLQDNDLIVWDAQFGPGEGETPLDMLLTRPGLELLALRVPDERMNLPDGKPYEVYYFARRDAVRREEQLAFLDQASGLAPGTLHRLDTLTCDPAPSGWCFTGTEFPIDLASIPLHHQDLIHAEVTVSGLLSLPEGGDMDLVFAEEGASGRVSYWAERLRDGPFEVQYRVPPRDGSVENKIYVWNRSRSEFRLLDFRVSVRYMLRGA